MDDTNYYENMIACLRAECDALRQQQANDAETITAAANTIRSLRAERDALAAPPREWRECDEAGRHPECNAESWRPWRREIAAKVDAALKDKP